MTRVMLRQIVFAASCLLASPLVSAAGQNCAAMEASGPQWFAAQLDKVQVTYQNGNNQGAYQQLREAMYGLPRRVDVSLDARCVGTAQWQRMYQLRRTITATLGQQAEKAGELIGPESALDWYVRGDNLDAARRVIGQLTATAGGAAAIVNRLHSEIGSLDHAQELGFELLPDERSARTSWQKELDGAISYARKRTAEILEKESDLLTRTVTSKEEQLEVIQETRQAIVTGILGDESLAVKNEAQREVNRAQASLAMLVAAQDWSQSVSADATTRVIDRAVMRGNALMAQAGNSKLSLEARASLYGAADNYFEFAGNGARRQAAAQGLAAVAPALQAERDARSARIDERGAELKESALQMKESMHKTEAQKQSFKDEADAMEDALGF